MSDETIKEQARLRLTMVGVADKAHKYPHELFEGERRCVAVARALAHGTRIVLLEEPTLGMSSQRRTRILELLSAVLRIGAVDAIALFTADAKALDNLPTRYLDLSPARAPLSLPVDLAREEVPSARSGN